MAREYARVQVSIWADLDFRALTPAAQHLYFMLLTSPTLNLAGIADWRPVRLAKMSDGWSAAGVRKSAAELEGARFIVVDEDTEEVLIRSFVRHDGVLKSPNITTSMVKDYAGCGSVKIMEAIAVEVQRASSENPEWKGLREASSILNEPIENHFETLLAEFPSTSPIPHPSTLNQHPSTSEGPAASKTPKGTRLPDDFVVTAEMKMWANAQGFGWVNLDAATAKFIDHWHSVPGAKGVKLDWVATWRNWVRTDAERGTTSKPAPKRSAATPEGW